MKVGIESQAVPALAVVIGLFFQMSAVAAELDCGDLAGRLKSGDDYQIHLELQSQKIRIELGDDVCSEPAKTWFDRQLILPSPAKREMALPPAALEAPRSEVSIPLKAGRGNDAVPLPGQKMRRGALPDLGFDNAGRETMPLPIQRAGDMAKVEQSTAAKIPVAEQPEQPGTAPDPAQPATNALGVRISNDPEGGAAKVTRYQADPQGLDPPPFSGGVAAPPLKQKPVYKCDRELTDFWKAGEHLIDGQLTNLTGVFTVDLDNDGRVDNVGFKIGASGRIGNVLGYFPVAKGRLAAQSIATLKLDNEDDIHRLCAGDVTFSTMTTEDKQKAFGSAKRRETDLQAKAKPAKKSVKAEEEATKDAEAEVTPEMLEKDLSAKEKTENLLFWAIVIATVFLLMGGVGLYFAVRNMRSGDDEDEDDGEENE